MARGLFYRSIHGYFALWLGCGHQQPREDPQGRQGTQPAWGLPLSTSAPQQSQSKAGTGCSCRLWPLWAWCSVPFSPLGVTASPPAKGPASATGRFELEQAESVIAALVTEKGSLQKSYEPQNCRGGWLLTCPACSLVKSCLAPAGKGGLLYRCRAAQGLQGRESKGSLAPGSLLPGAREPSPRCPMGVCPIL